MQIIKIKKIKNNSKKYDIETKTHNFYANDILVHNSSATYYCKDNKFGVCSRNLELLEDENNTYWVIANKYNLKENLANKNIAIQGELYGSSIQKNPLGIIGQDLAVFNVFDIDSGKKYTLNEMKEFCKKTNLNMVEIIEEGENFNYSLEDLEKKSQGMYKNTKNQREGIVIRSKDMKISFKVINPQYKEN